MADVSLPCVDGTCVTVSQEVAEGMARQQQQNATWPAALPPLEKAPNGQVVGWSGRACWAASCKIRVLVVRISFLLSFSRQPVFLGVSRQPHLTPGKYVVPLASSRISAATW